MEGVVGCAGVGGLIVFCLQLSGSDVARKLIMMAQVVAKSAPETFVAYNPNDPTTFSEVNGKNNRAPMRDTCPAALLISRMYEPVPDAVSLFLWQQIRGSCRALLCSLLELCIDAHASRVLRALCCSCSTC